MGEIIHAYAFLTGTGFRRVGGAYDPNYIEVIKQLYQGRIYDVVTEQVRREDYDDWVLKHDRQLTSTTFTRVSQLTGVEHTRTFLADPAKLQDWEEKKITIEQAFPYLTDAERLFIERGLTQEEQQHVESYGLKLKTDSTEG
jgi:hypothetical protein